MELDPTRCYRALQTRDRRFDGRFFTGVRTTGVYCRPVCPAPTPKSANVVFFGCAAAAEDAGFRPCLRCRPETAPGTPAWAGTSAVVARALRFIESGMLDDGNADGLAARLGIGERQLRRLFVQHLGAAPLAIARTRRSHFAARLLAETDWPVSHVALAAGFTSVRRFNEAMRDTFQRPPRELRARTPRASAAIRLPYRPPFDAAALWRYLAARAVPGVEAVGSGRIRRALRVDGQPVVVEVTLRASEHALEVRACGAEATQWLALAERANALGFLREVDEVEIDGEGRGGGPGGPVPSRRPPGHGRWTGPRLRRRRLP